MEELENEIIMEGYSHDFSPIQTALFSTDEFEDETLYFLFLADYPFSCTQMQSLLSGQMPQIEPQQSEYIHTLTIAINSVTGQTTGKYPIVEYLDSVSQINTSGFALQILNDQATKVILNDWDGQGTLNVNEFSDQTAIQGEFDVNFGQIHLMGHFKASSCDFFDG